MQIHGFQKMTLLDFPGRVACTVFLAGCNFRCPFCHNSELWNGQIEPVMDDTTLLTFLEKRKGLLDGVAFTGGEPLMNRDLPALIRSVRKMGYAVKLDTDGAFPDRLKSLFPDLDYIAMDIKNSPQHYPATCGVEFVNLDKIRESIHLIMHSGIDYEFRTTVVHPLHNMDSFHGIGEMIRDARRYYLQAFTDRDTVPFQGFSAPDRNEMEKYAEIMSSYVNSVEIRGLL